MNATKSSKLVQICKESQGDPAVIYQCSESPLQKDAATIFFSPIYHFPPPFRALFSLLVWYRSGDC